jgi:hypothetical protein
MAVVCIRLHNTQHTTQRSADDWQLFTRIINRHSYRGNIEHSQFEQQWAGTAKK